MNRIVRTIVPFMLVLSLLAVGGCAKDAASELDPPAQAVQSLLELRYERSTDASAYAELLSTPELAAELARVSQEETATTPPTPEWESPYVSLETTSTADVVVVWKDRTEHPDWPPVTIFSMQLIEQGRWAAADARTLGETETVPPPAE